MTVTASIYTNHC